MSYPIKTVHKAYAEYKTRLQWNKLDYAVKKNNKPIKMWSNGFCQQLCDYYSPEQVRLMTDKEKTSFQKRQKALRDKKIAIMNKRNQEQYENDRKYERRKQLSSKIGDMKFVSGTEELIVIDTETTGLVPENDDVLQVSIINGNGETLYNGVINDSWSVAERVNGITPEMVSAAPEIEEEIPKIAAILKSAKKVLGYNTDFDLSFLSEYGCECAEDAEIIDLMLLFAEVYGEYSEQHGTYKWQSLTTCAAYYGYDWGDDKAHDSLADCRATLYCYFEMLKNSPMGNDL